MFNKKKAGFQVLNNAVPDTLISENVTVTGNIGFSGGIQIDGTLLGDITAEKGSEARLWITESGKIIGNIKVPSITVNGTVEGDLYSGEHLELAANAVIKGNVYYKVIEMAQGAMVNGELHKEEQAKASVTNLEAQTHSQETQTKEEVRERAAKPEKK